MINVGFDCTAGIYTVWTEHVSFEFDRLRWDRYHQLGAGVTVTVTFPAERQIHSAWATLTTTDGRAKLAKHLATRESEQDWPELVETACVRVRNHFRLGEPALLMEAAPDVELGEAQLRDSQSGDTVLPRNEFAVAFGDGDTGKCSPY